MIDDKQALMAEKALRLKKAWLLACAMYGISRRLTVGEIAIPDYQHWDKRRLKTHLTDLEDDFGSVARLVFLHWKRSDLAQTSRELALRYDAWANSGKAVFGIGRVQEFENATGPQLSDQNPLISS